MKESKQLTKAETQVMQALWSLPAEGALSAEIMERMPEPKPADLGSVLGDLGPLTDLGEPRLPHL